MTDIFVYPDKKSSYIFSNINLLNTDTGHFSVFQFTNSHINLDLQTLVINALSVTEYFTS